jgi:hypothetical protein
MSPLDPFRHSSSDPPAAQSDWLTFFGTRAEAEAFANAVIPTVGEEGMYRVVDLELTDQTPKGNRYRVRVKAYWELPRSL